MQIMTKDTGEGSANCLPGLLDLTQPEVMHQNRKFATDKL